MSIKDELLAIKGDKPLLIVEEAEQWARENPESDLYKTLEWDNERAGHQYRLQQIRHLVTLHIVSEKNEPQMVSLSIDRVKPGGGYRSLDEVGAMPDLRAILFEDALKELERAQVKYQRIEELRDVWDALAKVKAKRQKKAA